MTQNMRLVCLPSELSAFWSAGIGSGAGVGTAVWGFDCVAASACVAESPVLPDCWVCFSSAGPLGSSGTAPEARRVSETEKETEPQRYFRMVCNAYSNRTACWRAKLHFGLWSPMIYTCGVAAATTMDLEPDNFCFIPHTSTPTRPRRHGGCQASRPARGGHSFKHPGSCELQSSREPEPVSAVR